MLNEVLSLKMPCVPPSTSTNVITECCLAFCESIRYLVRRSRASVRFDPADCILVLLPRHQMLDIGSDHRSTDTQALPW